LELVGKFVDGFAPFDMRDFFSDVISSRYSSFLKRSSSCKNWKR